MIKKLWLCDLCNKEFYRYNDACKHQCIPVTPYSIRRKGHRGKGRKGKGKKVK